MTALAEIKGIGSEYADLLEAAGVDSVPELAHRNADNLAGTLAKVDEDKRLVRQAPSAAQVQVWSRRPMACRASSRISVLSPAPSPRARAAGSHVRTPRARTR
jgi:predicted RecB family nuclease